MDCSGGAEAADTDSAPPEAFKRKAAHYLFHGQTTSLCEQCLELVPAKVIIEDDKIFYLKRCRTHGVQKTLISDDVEYWRQQKLWIKPGDRPLTTQTRPKPGARSIADCAPIMSSTAASRSSRSTKRATWRARCALPTPPTFTGATARWSRSNACSMRWSTAKASRTWCRFRAGSRPFTRTFSRSSTR